MSLQLGHQAKSEASLGAFFRRQLREKAPAPAVFPSSSSSSSPAGTTTTSTSSSLAGQTAIVTGSNTGLGLEACRQLLGLGLSRLVMAVRTVSKGESAAGPLRAAYPGARIDVWRLDMESYESIVAFVKKCRGDDDDEGDNRLERIDMVLLNAGMQNASYKVSSEEGPRRQQQHEQTYQVNYLSTSLLTLLLLPVLEAKRAPGAPVPILSAVSSDTTYWAKVDVSGTRSFAAQFDDPGKFSTFSWYSASKQCLNWFVIELLERLHHGGGGDSNGKNSNVQVGLVNPGLCHPTSLGDDAFRGPLGPLLKTIASFVVGLVARTPEQGASVYVDALVAQRGVASAHGSFASDWSIKPFPEVVYTEAGRRAQKALWDETMAELRGVEGVEGALRDLGIVVEKKV